MTNHQSWQKGLTITELLLTLMIGSLLIAAITTLMAAAFQVPKREQEQGTITAEGRRVLDQVSDELRGAQSIDWNGNGRIDNYYHEEYWLLSADRYSAVFYVYDDRLGEVVKVTYYLDGTNFKRQVTRLSGSSSGCAQTPDTPTIVASGIRNNEQNQDIFCYKQQDFPGNHCMHMPVGLPRQAKYIEMTFIVDADTQQAPSSTTIRTAVRPRGGMHSWPLNSSTAACADCIDNDGDGTADYNGAAGLPADTTGCDNANDPEETGSGNECDNGLDDDHDQLTDFRADDSGDPQCLDPSGASES